MPLKQNIILGISPGSRTTGYAIMSDGELVDWGEKQFKSNCNNQRVIQLQKMMKRILEDYNISHLAIKRVNPTKSSIKLDQVYSLFKSFSSMHHLKFSSSGNKEIKASCSKAKNKKEVIMYIRQKYPEMGYLPITSTSNHFRVYEAIAVILSRN